ncbi:MAG: hypothetical protein IT317_19595 [Anaerolineales bacterium]|nr:hypothetical protein [Anaerolineales bacterium]
MAEPGKLRIPLVGVKSGSRNVRGNPDVFFAAVERAYAQAEATAGRLTREYAIAGRRVRLQFAGEALLPHLTPALAHRATTEPGAPDLTVCVWETATTGSAAPPPAWDYTDFQPNGLIDGFSTDELTVAFELGSNALSVVHHAAGRAYYWVKQAKQVPYFDRGAPLRVIFHTWFSRQGVHLTHAGAVGWPEGGVLLAGRSGSGKSNTALALLASDLRYASDDYCLLTGEPQAHVYSLYSSGKTHAADLERLPFLRPAVSNPRRLETEKALYFLQSHFADRLIGGFPVRGLLLPRVAAGQARTTLRRVSAAQGLAALAPSTVAQLPGIRASDFHTLVALARQAPSYALEVGSDPEQLITAVTQLVEALNAGAPPR